MLLSIGLFLIVFFVVLGVIGLMIALLIQVVTFLLPIALMIALCGIVLFGWITAFAFAPVLTIVLTVAAILIVVFMS